MHGTSTATLTSSQDFAPAAFSSGALDETPAVEFNLQIYSTDKPVTRPFVETFGLPLHTDLPDLSEFAGKTRPEPEQVGRAIYKLFEHAISRRLQFPKIRLIASDGQVVVLRRPGERSKYAGQILLVDQSRWPENAYFGRIDLDGVLYPGRDMTRPVRELLERLAADPARVAFEYGKLTGHCCFCNLPLSDTRSTAHGYGPICAEHYGLPWDANRKLGGFQGIVDERLERRGKRRYY